MSIGGKWRVVAFVPLVIATILTIAIGVAHAGIYDPKASWKTIETEHFRIHHPARIGEVAKKAARILEEIYPEVTAKWEWRPWSYTEVILLDSSDEASGFASVLPYNWMKIYVAPPRSGSSLANYDDWLKMLLVHEFTHIVQIDAYGGVWIPMRIIFGKTVSPSGIDPVWMREGIAQYDETIFTKGGRGRGSYSEMVVRTAILEGAFPPIDVADGLGWRWPGYKAAYVYGIKFIQWLIDKYGEDRFMKLDRRIRKSILLSMINHQAKNAYGKTFYELWREWKKELEIRYGEEREAVSADGITGFERLVASHRDEQYYAPALSPDGKRLVYSATSPHGHPQIRIMDMETGAVEVLQKKHDSVQFSWSPDGSKIVYAKLGGYKRYYRPFDLWLYDFGAANEKERVRRLTGGMRARDPDFYPDGKSIVFVVGDRGTDVLKTLDLDTKKVETLTKDVLHFTQFANPRVSPDGRFIAVSVWRPGDGWRIYRYNADGSKPVRLTMGSGLVVENGPVWTRDGRHVIFASDESGIGNLYRVSPDGRGLARITNVVTGAFQPTAGPDGGIIAQRYHSKGYEIVRFDVEPRPEKGGRRKSGARRKTWDEGPARHPPKAEGEAGGPVRHGFAEGVPGGRATSDEQRDYKSRKYVAFGQSLFLPRMVVPNVAYVDDALFLTLFTRGTDPLHWQNWSAGATYRTDANHIGYFLNYWYARFRPAVGFSVNDYAVDFGNVSFPDVYYTDGNLASAARVVHFFEHRRGLSLFAAVPFWKNVISAAYFYEDHMPKTSLNAIERLELNLGKFAGVRAEYRYGDSDIFPASISNEGGRSIRLTTAVTNSIFGSGERNEQIIFSGDWREYVSPWRHHVLALRAAGGMTWGDQLVQGTFGMGGALGEGAFGGGGSHNYFPLRGLPASSLSRTRAMLFSGEYRFPLISPQRGFGTIPMFLEDISAALFADYGNAWNAHERGSDRLSDFFDDFMLGIGAELRGDFVIGHGLPIHGRVGYAMIVLNRDRLGALTDPILNTRIKYGFFILALGASF